MRILLIGCGAIATKGHGPALRRYAAAHADVELVACVDQDAGKAKQFAERFGFRRTYTDVDQALALERPDAVSLIVPATLIAELAVRILEQGYPLLLEKPPGLSTAEALRIADAARRGEGGMIANQVAFNRRYMPVARHTRELLADWTREGKLHHISYDMYRVGRTDPEDASVTAIHGIDVLRHWAGSDYREIHFRYRQQEHLGARVTNVMLEGQFLSGTTFQLNYFPVSGAVLERVSLVGEHHTLLVRLPFWTSSDSPGHIALYSGNQTIGEWGGAGLAATEESDVTNGFYSENAVFFDHIRAGTHPDGDILSALQSVEVAEHILHRKVVYRTGPDQ